MSSDEKSSSDKMLERLSRYPSESKFMMLRNLSYGAAGVCLVLVGFLTQVKVSSGALTVALYSAACGMPLWICLGGVYEHYIAIGPKSFSHFRGSFAQNVTGALSAFGGISLLAAVCGVLYYLAPTSVLVFGGASAAAIIVWVAFHIHISSWFFASDRDSTASGIEP